MKIINSAYHEEKNTKTKCSFADMVTETDERVERVLFGLLKEKYPDHHFIGEESTNEKILLSDNPTWIIDPIDGTTNFVHRFPYCSISIGFFLNKTPKIGVVYNPITDELFSAIDGQGAYLNGKTLVSSKQTELEKSQIITEFGSGRDPNKMKIVLENMHNIIGKAHR
jgi:myo-inositol-1(or 4)-monophosphatase